MKSSYTAIGVILSLLPNHTLAPQNKGTIAYSVFNLCFEIFKWNSITDRNKIEIYYSKFLKSPKSVERMYIH